MSKQVQDNKEMQEDLRKREAELKREMEEQRQVPSFLPTSQLHVIGSIWSCSLIVMRMHGKCDAVCSCTYDA